MGLLDFDDGAPRHERSASVAYRLRPPCWPRRATSRSIHLEPLKDLGHIGKPERQQIYPRCLYAYDVDALSQRWFAKILVFGRLRETHSSRNCKDTFLIDARRWCRASGINHRIRSLHRDSLPSYNLKFSMAALNTANAFSIVWRRLSAAPFKNIAKSFCRFFRLLKKADTSMADSPDPRDSRKNRNASMK